jgi:hypothetical protein
MTAAWDAPDWRAGEGGPPVAGHPAFAAVMLFRLSQRSIQRCFCVRSPNLPLFIDLACAELHFDRDQADETTGASLPSRDNMTRPARFVLPGTSRTSTNDA